MDIFTTARLTRLVRALDEPASFLLDTFFPDIQTEPNGSEEIHFDIDKSKPRITPFVHPMKPGRVVADIGYETKSFKPAYAKDKRVFQPNAPLRRTIGEAITGDLSPMERRERQVARSMADQKQMITRRLEVMASEVLRTGSEIVQGDDYPAVTVNFGRDAALTVPLAGAARWGEAGVSPFDDVESWVGLVQEKSGAVVDTVVHDPLSWKLFKADPKLEKQLDTTRRASSANLDTGILVRGQGAAKARFMGTNGSLNHWVYQDVYVNDAGATTKMLPDHSVILGARGETGVWGARAFGTILDEKAQYQSLDWFAKSWLEEDPAVRWVLGQCAPLIVPYRPNATFYASVR
jgi:hypothetical protein